MADKTDAPDAIMLVADAAGAGDPRAKWRPLAFAYIAFFGFMMGLMGAVSLLGSPDDGSPSVTLKLGSFPQATSGVIPADFHQRRELNGNLVSDPALLEDSTQGPLPMIGKDGTAPMTAYARPFNRGDKRPKVALLIGGLGVGAKDTERALSQLPIQVTLAFSPYAPDAQSFIDKARGAGHELLLEVPMEPFDFPESDPGHHALLVGAASDENVKRLDWALSRFTGYVGATNILGGRFLGETAAIEPVLAELAKRGLLFFDNGQSSRSVAGTAARHAHAAFAAGTLALDAVQTQAAIDKKLIELENQAHQEGFAIGVGSVYPVTIARVSQWAARAEARGFQLVPISALAAIPADASASAR
jgi:polysaccharide deacetylase 2 family uncharacterized protein YibQ